MNITIIQTLFTKIILPLVLLFYIDSFQLVIACTRVLFVGNDNTVITGRSMDWIEEMRTNIWVFPRGIKRNGEAGTGSPTWTTKYGSIASSVYELATADGMNEKGLVMNMLYLVETDYGKSMDPKKHPPISISLWGQYALDNFATVAEAVTAMQNNPFQILSFSLPNGEPSQVHLSLSDVTGDSAIFEYVDGKLIIHHSKEYKVMTNSPIYSRQLAINEYWQDVGGAIFLPGTNRAVDRFARASFFIQTVPKTLNNNFIKDVPYRTFENQARSEVLSIMRAVSVPLGITTADKPNIASTIWRTMSDQKHLIYYFDSSTSPTIFWVSLKELNLAEGAPILKLSLDQGEMYSGEVAKQFKPSEPLKFLGAALQIPK